MSYAEQVFQAMREDKEYTPVELSDICHIKPSDASAVLKMLVRGGVVECVNQDRFLKKRKFKTLQKALTF